MWLSPPCLRMYGHACATYESASLRMFRLGRTDTIRSTSVDSLKFVQSMDSPDKSVRISEKWSKRNPEKRKTSYLANPVSSGFSYGGLHPILSYTIACSIFTHQGFNLTFPSHVLKAWETSCGCFLAHHKVPCKSVQLLKLSSATDR